MLSTIYHSLIASYGHHKEQLNLNIIRYNFLVKTKKGPNISLLGKLKAKALFHFTKTQNAPLGAMFLTCSGHIFTKTRHAKIIQMKMKTHECKHLSFQMRTVAILENYANMFQ